MKNKEKVFNSNYLETYNEVILSYFNVFGNMLDMADIVPAGVMEESYIKLSKRFTKDIKIAEKRTKKNMKIDKGELLKICKEEIKENRKLNKKEKVNIFKKIFAKKKKNITINKNENELVITE